MSEAASLKRELVKTEEKRIQRRPEDNEQNSRLGTARLNGLSISNESNGALLRGVIPAAEGEHLRGLHGGNNGALGTYTHEDRLQADLTSLREELDKGDYKVRSGGSSAVFTPSHYASWLQIWGDPREAVRHYTRYLELKEKKRSEDLGKEEERELAQLERLEKSAKEFDDARHYMQEKRAYTQQDIDYAFSQNRHRKGGSASELFGTAHQAAGVYQSRFLDGIFGGMKESFLSGESDGGISASAMEALQQQEGIAESLEGMKLWLDRYLSGCVKKQQRRMAMILRGIRRSDPKHTRATILQYLEQVLSRVYFKREFVITNTDARMLAADRYMGAVLALLMRDPESEFSQLIRVLLDRIMAEKV